jgi:hypothetical protein
LFTDFSNLPQSLTKTKIVPLGDFRPLKPPFTKVADIAKAKYVAPQFFCFPEMITDDSVRDRFAFVYELRSALETHEMTECLEKWANTPRSPFRNTVFPGNHVRTMEAGLDYGNTKICESGAILAFWPANSAVAFVIAGDGTAIRFSPFKIDLDIRRVDEIPVLENGGPTFDPRSSLLSSNAPNVDSWKTTLFAPFYGDVIFARNPDKIDSLGRSIMPVHTEAPIVTLAVSEVYRLMVVATADHRVHFYSLPGGKRAQSCKTENLVLRILITEKWGFAVLDTQPAILLFNVNGNLIKTFSKEYPWYQVRCWSAFAEHGRDFIVFVDQSDNVRYFEAFYPEREKKLAPLNLKVPFALEVHYRPSVVAFAVLSANGNLVREGTKRKAQTKPGERMKSR